MRKYRSSTERAQKEVQEWKIQKAIEKQRKKLANQTMLEFGGKKSAFTIKRESAKEGNRAGSSTLFSNQ